MSTGGGIIADLIAEGVSPALIERVADVLADARAAERMLERRRASDRERQATRRHVMSRDSADVTVCHDETPLPAPAPSFPPDPQTNPTPTHTPGITPRARKDPVFVCPEGIDPQHWSDLLANRKTKRLTNSRTAYQGLLRDLAKFADDEWPPGRIIQFAAEAGWGAIFDPRTNFRTQQNGRSGTNGLGRDKSDGLSATTRAANRVFGTVAPGFGAAVPR